MFYKYNISQCSNNSLSFVLDLQLLLIEHLFIGKSFLIDFLLAPESVCCLKSNLNQLLNIGISIYCLPALAVTMAQAHLLLTVWVSSFSTQGIFSSFWQVNGDIIVW